MKTNNKLRNRKAVSPVIATVILVAVTIAVAVGVTYWMAGISAQYTSFEKVEIQTGYSTYSTSGWLIDLSLKNSGSATATITHIFVNDVPVTLIAPPGATNFAATNPGVPGGGSIATDLSDAGLTFEAGQSNTIQVWIDINYKTLSPGTTVNIKLHSAGGMDYIKLVKLT